MKDAAMMLQVLAGRDPLDSTTADIPVPDFCGHIGKPVAGMKIGVPLEYFEDGLDPEVRAAVEFGMQELVNAGAEIIPISLPHTDLCHSDVLRHRNCGSVVKPGALRWRALRIAIARGKDSE